MSKKKDRVTLILKANIGESVFYLTRDGVGQGDVEWIKVTKAGTMYEVNNKKFSEDMIFLSRQELADAILNEKI